MIWMSELGWACQRLAKCERCISKSCGARELAKEGVHDTSIEEERVQSIDVTFIHVSSPTKFTPPAPTPIRPRAIQNKLDLVIPI
jgi:hypothetical protein